MTYDGSSPWGKATSYYAMYEMAHAAFSPARAFAGATKHYFTNPVNPMAHTVLGRSMAAACEVFERTTRRYGKPEFGINPQEIDPALSSIIENEVWDKPFCKLINFKKNYSKQSKKHTQEPKVLIVAPMSGHYATLLRGTVESFLPNHNVFITDWQDARNVPLTAGNFDLDDYIDYVIEMLEFLGDNTHVVAVCQPSVPVLAAVALMEAAQNPLVPKSMTLMGGPIDTRVSPTGVNKLAREKGLDWFRANVITKVPLPNAGFMRDVYPGFLQLTGFMTMNLDRHVNAHKDLFHHLVKGDGDNVTKHTEFYDEYLAVMDLTAEFYLQTIETVFITHALPRGEMMHRGTPVNLNAIRNVALLTIEGENDDITGGGQTEAAHTLCANIPAHMKHHHLQMGVGHYGVFNGSRFRKEIMPVVNNFILDNCSKQEAEEAPIQAAAPQKSKKATAPKKPKVAAIKQNLKTVAAHPTRH